MKIKGIPVGTTTPRSNWAQTDPRKADFILNKPSFEAKQNQLSWVTDEDLDAMFDGTYEGVDKETYIDDDFVVDTLYAMTDVIVAGNSLKNLTGGIYLGSGDMPANCNVQIDPNGDAMTIEEIAQMAADLVPIPKDNPLPTEIATEEEMTALLDTADVGSVYKYADDAEESGIYENGALYVVEESE